MKVMGKTERKVLNDAKRPMAKVAIFHKEIQNTQIFNKIT